MKNEILKILLKKRIDRTVREGAMLFDYLKRATGRDLEYFLQVKSALNL